MNDNEQKVVDNLKERLETIMTSFLFKPYDMAMEEATTSVNQMLAEELVLEHIYDYAVVCDKSNNPPTEQKNGMLKLDICVKVEPIGEFIFIPILLHGTTGNQEW